MKVSSRHSDTNKNLADNEPTPLQELAGIEIKKRKLTRQLIELELDREKFLLEIRLTGASLYTTTVEKTPDNRPTPLQELAGHEIKKRELLRVLSALQRDRQELLLIVRLTEASLLARTLPS